MSNTWFRMIRDSQEYIEKISNQLIQDKKSQHMQVLEVMGTTHFSIYCDSDKKYMILKFWKEWQASWGYWTENVALKIKG